MNKKIYYRGKIGTYWYNFTEGLAYTILHRPTPKFCDYEKIKYGDEKMQYFNCCTLKKTIGGKKPVFIYIHGGGWVSGITEMRDTYVAEWAKRGFATFSISYTYAPEKVYPAQVGEICAAIDKIYELADIRELDMSRIVLAGESAGGYYIMRLAEFAADKTLAEKTGVVFRNNDKFKVNAIVSNCGCFDLKNLLDPKKEQHHFPDIKMMVSSYLGMSVKDAKAYLETESGAMSYPHVTADFPPAFIIWAERDWLRYEAFDLMNTYRDLGLDYDAFKGTGLIGLHGWPIATFVPEGGKCLEKAYEFVKKYL